MLKRLLCINLIFGFSLSSQSYKQMLYDYSFDLKTVDSAAQAHFDQVGREEGSGFKAYERWKWENVYQFPLDGNRSKIDPYFTAKQWQQLSGNLQKVGASTTWQDLGPYTVDSISGHYSPGLGRVECFYVDPLDTNIIYLGSRSGGFWHSADGGQTWSNSTTDFLVASGVNTMAVKPGQHDTLLINVRNAGNGTTHGIYRSTDGGQTWTQSAFNPNALGWGGLGDNSQIFKIAYHPDLPNKVYIGTSQGLFISDDDLQTWTRVLASADITQIAFHPSDTSVLYVYDNYYWTSNPNQILVSKDGGQSFSASAVLGSNGNAINVQIAVSPACPDCVWAADRNGVWKSTDQGDNFTFMVNPSGVCDGFAVHDQDTSHMIYGMLDIFASNNGGQSFNQVTWWAINNARPYNGSQYVHADLREIACINGTYYIGTDGFLCKSYDKGQTWQKLSENNGIRENYALGLSQSDQAITMSGSQDNGTSIYRGDHWLEFYGADGMEALVHPLNPDWMMGSVQFGTRRLTRDGGYSQRSATPANQSGSWEAPLLSSGTDHFKLFHLGDKVYQSTNFGDNWTELGSPLFNGSIDRAAIAPNNDQIIAVSKGDDLEISINGGNTFRRRSTGLPTGAAIREIAFHPFKDSVLLVSYGSHQNNGNKVFLSQDQGLSWQNITSNLGDMPILSAVIGPDDQIYLGAEIGVYVKDMNASNWMLYNNGLPNMRVNDLEINWATNTLRAATWGRGMWEISLKNRASFPKLNRIDINDLPTLSTPKEGVPQFVSAKIAYTGSLSSVYVRCSVDDLALDSIIPLQLQADSSWQSIHPLPSGPEGSLVYFSVFAVGDQGDTTRSYRFNYRLREFEYCAAAGASNTTVNYIDEVVLANLQNSSGKDSYGDFTNQFANLQHNQTYTLLVGMNYHFDQDTIYAWIDYDQDRSFEADELITFGAIDPNHEALGTFTVPSSIGVDTTRMRIRSRYWNGGPDPCDTHTGEVEDYSVIINGSGLGAADLPFADLSLYPNPVEKELHLRWPSLQESLEVELSDQSGKVLYRSTFGAAEAIDLDLSFLKSGLYQLKVEAQDQARVIPFVKQ